MITYTLKHDFIEVYFKSGTDPIAEICLHPIRGWIFFDNHSCEHFPFDNLHDLKDFVELRYGDR